MNIKDSLREIKELQAVNSILSRLRLRYLFLLEYYFFPVSAHFSFANRFKSKIKPLVQEYVNFCICRSCIILSIPVYVCQDA